MKKRYITLIVVSSLVVIGGWATAMYLFASTRLAASDCTRYEQYDALMGECYFDCETDAECEAIASKVDAELNGYFAGSKTKIDTKNTGEKAPQVAISTATTPAVDASDAPVKQLTKADTGSETNGKIYTVSASQGLSPKPDVSTLELWTLFGRVASRDVVKQRIESFEVFDDSDNGTAAAVWASHTSGKWHVSVNAAYQNDRKDLIHTMVHEYGHIATLNDTQVEQTAGSACPRLSLPEGCSRDGSVVGEFERQFWAKYGGISTNWDRTDQDAATLYAKHTDAFVSEYAATNPVEDLAETFATFVLSEKPAVTTEKDQKVLFLYNSALMTSERTRIRAALAAELR